MLALCGRGKSGSVGERTSGHLRTGSLRSEPSHVRYQALTARSGLLVYTPADATRCAYGLDVDPSTAHRDLSPITCVEMGLGYGTGHGTAPTRPR
ncbi:hypothetical protein R1flu_017320 [Riccia fluitans]|uniref:Uncharacterized protein n=1 Tax=Riccia fluitans TaxID=41844 RepID=A0ABD1ZDN8_9MARC